MRNPRIFVQEKQTINIPNIGPGKPIRHHFDENSSYLMFPIFQDRKLAEATGGNLVRTIGYCDENTTCGICGDGYCQQRAGTMWYELTNWSRVHYLCWVRLCEDYYIDLRVENETNTLANWILFLSNEELID